MYRTLISPQELERILSDEASRVVDCRFSLSDTEAGRRAYLAGHIPGAVYAHLDADLSGPVLPGKTGRHPLPDPGAFADKLGSWGIDHASQIVAYDDQSGAIASRLWWMLRWLGHDAVAVLDGGFPAWQGPISTQIPAPPRARFSRHPRPELIADLASVERLRQSPDHRLLDARTRERFRGDVEPLDRVGGHIPGALSLPLGENLDAGRFRDPEAIRVKFLSVLGEVPPGRAVASCGSGVTACHLILAAEHAGLQGILLYPGSWSEWITDPGRPIARGD